MSTTTIQCPQCLAPLSGSAKVCEYCGSKIFVDSLAYLSNLDAPVIQKYIKSYKEKLNENLNQDKLLLNIQGIDDEGNFYYENIQVEVN